MAKVIVIMHGKTEDADPELVVLDNLTTEVILVNFIEGKVTVETRDKPRIIDADTGEEIQRP